MEMGVIYIRGILRVVSLLQQGRTRFSALLTSIAHLLSNDVITGKSTFCTLALFYQYLVKFFPN